MLSEAKKKDIVFKKYTLDDCIDIVCQLLPDGEFWQVKHIRQSNLYKLIYALATVLYEKLNDTYYLWKELDPLQAESFISDWETFVGIPDDTTPVVNNIIERRANVISRLVTRKLITIADYENTIKAIGFPYRRMYHARNLYNSNGFDYVFDMIFLSDGALKFGIILELYADEPTNDILKSFLEKIKPSGVRFIFIEY